MNDAGEEQQHRAGRRATYRLQLHGGFDFADAAAIAGYLAELGVSHVYLSPVLQAARGSTHGYDVVDPSTVNEELGGEAGHAELQAALGRARLGHVLDIVPNHMAVSSPDNRWWWDVLENGPSSVYASYFDVDWGTPEGGVAGHRSVVLLPILADHYGRELEAGNIHLEHSKGTFTLRYFDHRFPVAPRSIDQVVARAARRLPRSFDPAVRAELESIATALGRLPPSWATDRASVRERHRDKEVLRARLAALSEHQSVEGALDAETEATESNVDALDALVQRQNYRLAFWRTASEEGQYRRFFDINELVGIRVEDDAVFADSHRLILRWLHEGVIDGLRVDHIDGLRRPGAYLERLEKESAGGWVVVEKILAKGEQLPEQWPVAGTTGYDWLNLAGGLFVEKEGAESLRRSFGEFCGLERSWDELAHQAKISVLNGALSTDLNRVVERMARVCEGHRRHSDHTRRDLRECLAEVAASFHVYRTYVAPGHRVSEHDASVVQRAVMEAGLRRPEIDGELLSFLRDVLLLDVAGSAEEEMALSFQQFTGPVMAKAVEDTAFYRYMPLLAANEVGGDPSSPATSKEEFHAWCAGTQARHPFGLLATSTHDTKRSEDVRARMSVLSEIPGEWAETVRRWSALNRRKRVARDLPDPETEWMLYQTLVGAWPLSAERVLGFVEKAVREAKVHTSWEQPDQIYEGAVINFTAVILRSRKFVAELEAFVERICRPGRSNSLALKLLTLTAPGVPDLYQGSELWDLSLVDPDNRRPVDYDLRRRLLEEAPGAELAKVWAGGDDVGLTKLAVVQRALEVRGRKPASFGEGGRGAYRPLVVEGPAAEHALGYTRGASVACVVTRWPVLLERAGGWRGTTVSLPSGHWHDALGGGTWEGRAPLGDLFGGLPVALLERQGRTGTTAPPRRAPSRARVGRQGERT
ncbi:MAG: malto-oligosyltrehalose synthase [Actinomycetota bacterium]|jgi:(1->4)-alpha-D-glucan 1-alpha-D-glucosylmutase|nr:malto-oligosyltrehalose synthase [Actinomycetota bacterium]